MSQKKLQYQLDIDNILRNKIKINPENGVAKNIAILGGSTTNKIAKTIELFLLDIGITANYYESKHYRPHIGDMIAARIFSDGSKVVLADFGVFVTKKNIDKHLKRLNREIEEYDLIKARSL